MIARSMDRAGCSKILKAGAHVNHRGGMDLGDTRLDHAEG
jgi:hypothetical protein